MSKTIMLIICIFISTSCSVNRFNRENQLFGATLSMFGRDQYAYCNKIDPKFIDPYPNGKNPSKTCIRYQYYTCHINHYCNGDKNCETEAAQFWLPEWNDTENNLNKRAEITKDICESEAKACNSASMGDARCLRNSSDFEFIKKYQPNINDYSCLTNYQKSYQNYVIRSFKCQKYDQYLCRRDSICAGDKQCLDLLEKVMKLKQNKNLENQCQKEAEKCSNAESFDKSCLIE